MTLFILQYNIKNNKNEIMISLLTNKKIKKNDVLIIQKSWINFKMHTLYNSLNFDFHFLYNNEKVINVCFYVNKKINVDNWTINFLSKNICFFQFRIIINDAQLFVNIHNMYNSLFESYAINARFVCVKSLNQILNARSNEKYIMFENFNLHHSSWRKSFCFTQYTIANQFLNVAKKNVFAIHFIIWYNYLKNASIN